MAKRMATKILRRDVFYLGEKKRQEMTLTASGHQYDRELTRVSVKVSPAMQAVIANQHELIEIIGKSSADNQIFIDQHRIELSMVEDEIADAFAGYIRKKETAKAQRELKRENNEGVHAFTDGEGTNVVKKSARGRSPAEEKEYAAVDYMDDLNSMADRLSPGLPSEKFQPRAKKVQDAIEVDVRRVAIGASIKALSSFLRRDLTEEEIRSVEKQVESYL